MIFRRLNKPRKTVKLNSVLYFLGFQTRKKYFHMYVYSRIPEFHTFLIFLYFKIKTCFNSVRSSIIAKAQPIVGQLYGRDVCSSDDEQLEKVINLLANNTFIWLEEAREKSYDVGDCGPLS
jgi:hypothetical protein